MATKIIKLNNGTDTYAPVTLANAVQFNNGEDTPISVQEAIFSLVQMIFNVADNIPTTDDIATMTPATASAAGTKGFVPEPPAGSQNKVLTGAAEFKTISAFQDAHATGLLYKTMDTTEEFTLFNDTKFTGSPVSLATIASPAISVLLIKGHLLLYCEVVDASQPLPTISLDDTVNTPTLDAATNMFYLDSWSNAAPTSMSFGNKSNIKTIKKMQIDTSKVTDMERMFYNCSSLTSLDLSSFNTSSTNSFSNMFKGCSGLTSLDLSNFDTRNVTNFSEMFSGCSSLNSLNLTSFNTSSATNVRDMFSGCSGLNSLNLSSFNTSKLTSFSNMFKDCSGLNSLDLSNFDTRNVTFFGYMFKGCTNLKTLDLSHFDVSKATDFRFMFGDCKSLTALDLSGWTVSKSAKITDMFSNCNSLTTIKMIGCPQATIDKIKSVKPASATIVTK